MPEVPGDSGQWRKKAGEKEAIEGWVWLGGPGNFVVKQTLMAEEILSLAELEKVKLHLFRTLLTLTYVMRRLYLRTAKLQRVFQIQRK